MQNCWEFKMCGREPGGLKADEMGVCPAGTYEAADGFLGGKNGGRACAFIAGTFCCTTLPDNKRNRNKCCTSCSFYDNLRYAYGRDCSVSSFLSYIKAGVKSRSAEVLKNYPLSLMKRSGKVAKEAGRAQ